MMKLLQGAISLGVVFGLLVGASLAAAQVDPPSVIGELYPGESMHVIKSVTTPPIPPKVDICLLEDETGSFGDDIANLKALAGPGGPLISALDATGADYASCVLGFRDFAQMFWGSPGDWVYRMYADVTPGGAGFAAGVPLLTAGGGADGPEAQLEALHYLATPGHAAIDSNGDGDVLDSNDTPAGMQPNWRPGSQRVVLLATDASCHVTGDAGGWPGDAGTTSPAVTAGLLNSAGITVIGLTPYSIGCVNALASGTGGSVQSTTASGSDIVEAILAGLEELTTDVWWEAVCESGIQVSLDPIVHAGVPGATTVEFDESIEVPNETDPGMYHCTVDFIANEYPADGEPIGTQDIWILVRPIPVPFDIKPQSCRNPINVKQKGVLPVAVVGTADFDAAEVDPSTVRLEGVAPLRWDLEDVATPYEPYLGKQSAFDCTEEGADGYMDLTLKFDAQEVVAALGEVNDGDVLALELTADLIDGRAVIGEDVVVILEKGKD